MNQKAGCRKSWRPRSARTSASANQPCFFGDENSEKQSLKKTRSINAALASSSYGVILPTNRRNGRAKRKRRWLRSKDRISANRYATNFRWLPNKSCKGGPFITAKNITLIATGVPEIGKQASNPSSICFFKKFNRLNCALVSGPVTLTLTLIKFVDRRRTH